MALITCAGLSLGYEGREIIKDLNFTVSGGDYLCIVGENGSGKTTLMKTVLGLIPPMAGSVVMGDGLKAGEIGYLPQQTQVQRDFPASVREIVLSGCQSRQKGFFYKADDRALADRNIERMGIKDLRDRCYRELSGGQQQRVLLARALCAAGKMIVLDEPVAGLDPRVTAEMYRLIEDLNKKDGITVMMISHDIGAALRYASHILHIGRRVFFGTKEDYMSSVIGREFISQGGEDR
ncbi:MAG: metal ABC transporter ATP-binding protein [Firmicutes bacterium]|nr:metal ABC transporter ATP-binding protein [Bacillota bacterium]MBQ6013674.1 metal ABC transporter ATP-binding protein [Bacillota bacterium]MBQ6260812.1 metal ABC transporter ATP-binding protein [Bacillota bacterium]MBR0114564.1 metal ABC transporter ATP-binding protein [Bacillota bacterium]MBR0442205.1 metal ABC transporter ATP-binding protein [Bacillota bacterium]